MKAKKSLTKQMINLNSVSIYFRSFAQVLIDKKWQIMKKVEYIKSIDDMEEFADISWIIAQIQINIAEGFEKKDKYKYEFKKRSKTWKIEVDANVLELICIEKYNRTHDQFMETPKDTLDLLMIKREADAEVEKQKRFSSNK